MNKSSNRASTLDNETPSTTDGPLQAGPGTEPARLIDPRIQPEATERRSPHRVISTASYYHPERRGGLIGEGSDEFPEGPDVGDGMDGDAGFS